HLGISSLDVDTASGASERSNNIPGSEHIPESLVRRSEETVTSILSQPHRQSRIRLDALTRNFLEPLQDLLGKQSFFFSDEQPTSLDCLTLGYLALALYPDLPQPWLADIMREGFESLCAYVHNLRGSFFGGPVRIEDALSTRDGPAGADEAEAERNKRAKGKGPLPWLAPERGGLTTIGSLLLSNILDSIPLIDQLRASNRLTLAANESNLTEQEKAQVQAIATARRRELFSQVITVGAGISAFVGYLFYTGIVSLPGEEEEMVAGEKRGLADLGEAGAMLAMADYMDGRSQKGNTSEHHPVVEVDVEVDGERAM
ncbi:MAG: hypothetical protein M1830_004339, partial [Pleopsidium flavum]